VTPAEVTPAEATPAEATSAEVTGRYFGRSVSTRETAWSIWAWVS
jgi:hypothetical protein